MEKMLRDLNLLNKFLFDQTMDIPEAHEAALQIIFDDDNIKLLPQTQTEKEMRTTPWLRSVRMDVFSIDQNKNVYDTEMQAGYRNDLMKRSRYYQGLIDSSLLEPGVTSFNELTSVYIIIITPFELFGEGKYCYTFRPYCEENKDLLLKDGSTRIFLNTKGKNDAEVGKELIDFLHYIENTDGEFASQTGSERIKKIHACVKQVKSSEEMGVKYMQTWEERIIIRQFGRAEGEHRKLIEQVCKKLRKGKTPEIIAEELEEELEEIQCICDVASAYAPEYNLDNVDTAWNERFGEDLSQYGIL